MLRFITPPVIAILMALISASPLRADLTISTDTTQNGGTLVVDPAGVLLISDPMNDPLLTLTNGASSSGIQALLVGNLNAEGRLLIEEGSTLNSSLFALLGVSSGSEGTATVTDANSKWISGNGLTVGVSGTGTLNIENAGTVTNTNGTIADGAESVGTVNVRDVGSSWQNAGKLIIGNNGNGTLNISEGGKVTSTNSYIANKSGSEGNVHVIGNSSNWQESANLYVGNGGDGTLNIENGGSVKSWYGYLSYQAGSQGTVNIKGAGSQWESSSGLIVGYAGKGVVNVEDGGKLIGGGYIGFKNNSEGTVNVKGIGSQWISSNYVTTVGGATNYGSGKGTLNIEDGGYVSSPISQVGDGYNTVGIVNITGDGSTWATAYTLYLGYNQGKAVVNIKDGGKLTDTDGVVNNYYSKVNITGQNSLWQNSGKLTVVDAKVDVESGGGITSDRGYIGTNFYSDAAVVNITNQGSNWQNTNGLYIGYDGNGILNISDGGVVNSNGGHVGTKSDINTGYGQDPNGIVNVTNFGSQWLNSGVLNVGYDGTGQLNITKGGFVTSTSGYVGRGAGYNPVGDYYRGNGTVTVNGTSSQWQNTGSLNVGTSETWRFLSKGILNIEDGGKVTSSTGYIGYNYGTGIVTVTGEGSEWLNDGGIYIGYGGYDDDGDGTLHIQNGALATGSFAVIAYDGGVGEVVVDGSGSKWQIDGSISVGDNISTGKLFVQNGGKVELGDVLTVGLKGTLSGNGGTIIGDVLNQGTIAPGNSPGILTIDGDLHSTGLIQIQLAGTGTGYFDQLIVTGDLNLGGTIEVDLLDGFMPFTHNSFQIMNFGSLINSGYRFDFSHAALQPSFSWDTSTFAMDGTIRVIPEASSVLLAGIATFAGLMITRVTRR